LSGKAIGKTLNYGFAGNYARQPDMVINSFQVDAASRALKFGDAVCLTAAGTVTAFENGGTAAKFVGVASSEVKSIFEYNSMEGSYA